MKFILFNGNIRLDIADTSTQQGRSVFPSKTVNLVSQIHNQLDAARKQVLHFEHNRNFIPGFKEIKDFSGKSFYKNGFTRQCYCAADKLDANIFFSTHCSSVITDFNTISLPLPESQLKGYSGIDDIVNKIRIINEENRTATSREYINVPDLIVKPRTFEKTESGFMLGAEPVSASFFDLCVFLSINGRKLYSLGHTVNLSITTKSLPGAKLWKDLLLTVSDHCSIPSASIKLNLEIGTIRSVVAAEETLSELKEFVTSFSFDPQNIYNDWLRGDYYSDETSFVTVLMNSLKSIYSLSEKSGVPVFLKIYNNWPNSFGTFFQSQNSTPTYPDKNVFRPGGIIFDYSKEHFFRDKGPMKDITTTNIKDFAEMVVLGELPLRFS